LLPNSPTSPCRSTGTRSRGRHEVGGGNAEQAFMVAGAYEQLGDRAAALGWLEQALAKKYPLTTIERSPTLAELRKDARYKALVEKTK
jgi:hypothetical protein